MASEHSEGDEGLPRAICLMGPTASGKSELALELAERFPCEILSVDSVQVYRGMDIGAAKPSAEELARIPHRLIDLCDPAESYSAARFRADALAAAAEVNSAGRIPLLVGGTMLYFRALLHGLSAMPDADPGVRARLEQEAALRGWGWMHARLAEVDPQAAARIHPNDPQRIERALEVWEITGQPISRLQGGGGGEGCPLRVVKFARAPKDRAVLHQRIAERFRRMVDAGFEEEVRRLLARGDLVPDMPSLRAVGYRQMVRYLLGEYGREEMIEKGIIATRQLAKRQFTWLRAEPDLHWLDEEAGDLAGQVMRVLVQEPDFADLASRKSCRELRDQPQIDATDS